jgi:hypothetical protein
MGWTAEMPLQFQDQCEKVETCVEWEHHNDALHLAKFVKRDENVCFAALLGKTPLVSSIYQISNCPLNVD